jgi:hypothetical protein
VCVAKCTKFGDLGDAIEVRLHSALIPKGESTCFRKVNPSKKVRFDIHPTYFILGKN